MLPARAPDDAKLIKDYIEKRVEEPDLSRGQALRDVGYAESTARLPGRVESTQTFRELATQMGLIVGKRAIDFNVELGKRDLGDLSTSQVVDGFYKLTKAMAVLLPKDKDQEGDMQGIFSRVIDATPQEQETVNDVK